MPARLPVLIQVSRDHFAARKNVFVRRQPAHNRVFLFSQSEAATGVVCIGKGNRFNIIAFFIQHLDNIPPVIAAVDVRPICCNIRNHPGEIRIFRIDIRLSRACELLILPRQPRKNKVKADAIYKTQQERQYRQDFPDREISPEINLANPRVFPPIAAHGRPRRLHRFLHQNSSSRG